VAEQALAAVDDQLALEQLIDFVRVRNFRRALLCHAGVEVQREIALADVQALAYFADLPGLPAFDLTQERPETCDVPGGATATVAHPLVKAALAVLAERFPDSVAFADLHAESGRRAAAAGAGVLAEVRADLAAELFSLFASGAVRAEPSPRNWRTPAAERPRLTRLCRAQAAQGHLATPRHQALELDPFAAHLAGLLDGVRDRPALVAAMQAVVTRGIAGLSAPSGAVAANVERLLALFQHHGVLDG
jgi:methyltransferase-like protein